MIHYSLRCDQGDEFEAWFGSIADYDKQSEQGLISCPHCGSARVEKAPMAPMVLRRDRDAKPDPRAVAMAMAAQVKQHIQEKFDYVGDGFADEARKIHHGESEERPIWGEATPEQAEALAEEGVGVSPLPSELAPTPPRKLN
ncbi:MAG: DUF1178 family protein [Alphaproteobacteria bacterium]|nr:DUF1178 family protein [Alphaproteobacteria bacterium]